MMRLSILVAQESPEVKLPQDFKPFRWYAHHVSEIFLELFPENININNSSKITIEFGPQGNEPVFNGTFGCTNYFIESFDFAEFYKLDDSEKEYILLENIKVGLISIIKNNFLDTNIIEQIEDTTNKVIENKFSLEIEVKKLAKNSSNKYYKISIFRVLNKKVGEGWKLMKIDRKTKEVIEENWIGKIPSYLNRSDYYKKSEIIGNEYIIRNNLDEVVYKNKI